MLRSFWQQLLRVLGLKQPPGEPFRFDVDLVRSLHDLAEREQRPQAEVAAELLSFALAQRNLEDERRLRWDKLTQREQEVAALVCLGYTSRQVAYALQISPETVKSHVRSLLQKFGLQSRSELRTLLANWDFSAWDK